MISVKRCVCLELTTGSAGIGETRRVLSTVSFTLVMMKEKASCSVCWHKHAIVPCCTAMANTGISISMRLTRLMDLVPISRIVRTRLGLISRATKVGCVYVPSQRAIHAEDQEEVTRVVSGQRHIVWLTAAGTD